MQAERTKSNHGNKGLIRTKTKTVDSSDSTNADHVTQAQREEFVQEARDAVTRAWRDRPKWYTEWERQNVD